jgi:hypothetical protein
MPKLTNKIWTPEEDNYMREYYPTKTIADICTDLCRPTCSITSRASILGVKKILRNSRVSYVLNEEYFKNIDNPRKAYWYGFLWADGSMYNNNFELTLNKKDKHLIEQFKIDIGSTHPIKPHHKYNTFRFLISSKRFAYHLNQLNIINRKSYSSRLPIISDKYFFNFLMGLFDGDGCFTCGRTHIITTKEVALWLQQKLYTLLNLNSKIYDIKNCVAKRFNIQRRGDVFIIMEKLYQENSFYLERKRQKYEQFKKMEK